MKMKKLIAVGAAAAMSMAMCVNVLAASEVQNASKASYAGGKAAYTETITAKDGTQMTVLVFKKIDAAETVKDANIEYINQDAASAGLYAAMSTKNDLLAVGEDGTAKNAGDYIIRVGYYDAAGDWKVAQGSFTVATKADAPLYKLGDIDDDGYIGSPDALIALQEELGMNLEPLTSTQLLAADVDKDGYIGSPDALEMILCELGMSTILFN